MSGVRASKGAPIAKTVVGIPDVDAEVARFLAGRDVPCDACGYNLRGLGGRVCPECGRVVTMDGLRRSMRHRGGPPVVLAGIGVMMFAVIALPTAAFFLLMALGMMAGARLGAAGASGAILVGLGITGVLLFGGPLIIARLWDRWEARVSGLSATGRWAVAALCWSWVMPLPLVVLIGL